MDLLLVEDDDADAVLMARHLESLLDQPLTRAPDLGRAIEIANERDFDAVLLDLGLPDAWGLDALLRFTRRVPEVPVIVLSGTQGIAFEDKARRAGAVGFVSKTLPGEQITARVLELAGTAAASRHSASETELRGLDRIGRPDRLSATAKIYGRKDLAEADPELWEHYVGRYGDLLDLVIEQATFNQNLYVSEHLSALAQELGALQARPRDVISIHTTAVRRHVEAANGVGIDAVLAESRLAVLEMMGHLAAHYRTAALGLSERDQTGRSA